MSIDIQQNQKKPGTVSFIDNKVRINYSDGTDSVLFEDISSISYKSINQPNLWIFFSGIAGMLFSLITQTFTKMPIVSLLLFLLSTFIAFVFKTGIQKLNLVTN